MDLSVSNMPSLSHTLFGINQDIQTSQLRLATGLRINSAKDDASGLAQANLVTSEINENDILISDLAKTKAIGDYYIEAHDAAISQLQDIMTLVKQAEDSTITAEERTALQEDINSRVSTYDDLITNIEFNGVDIGEAAEYTVSKNGNYIINGNFSATSSKDVGGALNVSTSGNATTAYTTLDGLLDTLQLDFATAGVVSSTITTEAERLSKVNAILETSKAQIQDADVVAETAELTKNQILNQSTTALMGQSNTMQSAALTLLNGLYS